MSDCLPRDNFDMKNPQTNVGSSKEKIQEIIHSLQLNSLSKMFLSFLITLQSCGDHSTNHCIRLSYTRQSDKEQNLIFLSLKRRLKSKCFKIVMNSKPIKQFSVNSLTPTLQCQNNAQPCSDLCQRKAVVSVTAEEAPYNHPPTHCHSGCQSTVAGQAQGNTVGVSPLCDSTLMPAYKKPCNKPTENCSFI